MFIPFLIFISLSILLPTYAMENRGILSTIAPPLATRIFPLMTAFLLYKYKQYKQHKMNTTFQNAVIEACSGNSPEKNPQIIRKCIEDGVDIDYKIDENLTALMLAARFSNKELFNYLLQNGANVNNTDLNGDLPLHYFLDGVDKNPELFDAEIFEYLLKHTDPDDTQIKGNFITPLCFMSAIKNRNLIKLFIKHGLNVNDTDSLKITPLMYAVRLKNIKAIKEFCHAGASIDRLDNNGNTIFHTTARIKLPKEHIRALITHARCDSFNKNQKEKEKKLLTVLGVIKPFKIPNELVMLILNKLTLLDDDYCFNKKLYKTLSVLNFTDHIINHINKRINYISNIMRIQNNEGKFAISLVNETHDNQYIQDVMSLLNNRQLGEDITAFCNKLSTKNNIVYQIKLNCDQLLFED